MKRVRKYQVFSQLPRDQRNRREQPQSLFHTLFQVYQLLDVFIRWHPLPVVAEHHVDLLMNLPLAFGILPNPPYRECHSTGRGVVSFKHKSVDFLSDVFIRHLSLSLHFQKKVQECKSFPFRVVEVAADFEDTFVKVRLPTGNHLQKSRSVDL